MIRIWLITSLFLAFPLGREGLKQCRFCDPVIIQRQKFYEDEHILGLWDRSQLLKGHRLLISKRHVERFEDLSDWELLAMRDLLKKLKIQQYWIVQKNNWMNSVNHFHVHIIQKQNIFAFYGNMKYF
jgi:histidine triad (HIT) family protein